VLVDIANYQGRAHLYIPPLELDGDIAALTEGLELGDDFADFQRWAEQHRAMIEENQQSEHP
jgi:hypothetical protein